MTRAETPILSLETAPPAARSGVSAKGMLTALPVAVGVVGLIPAAIYLQFVLAIQLPSWFGVVFPPVGKALDAAFRNGPFVAVILIWITMFLVTLVHELGHAAGALLVGWPVTEFRVIPFSLQKQGDKWKLDFRWKMSPPGLVMAHPTATRFHSKVRVYALAGPAANLVAGLLLRAVQPSPEGSMWAAVSILLAGWSFVIGLFNLLPLHLRGLELDGYVALVVSRKPERLAARVAAIRMREHVHYGRPLESMNQRWIALAERVGRASLQNRGGMWFAYAYWLERDEFERAAVVLERLLQASQNFDDGFRAFLFAECAVLSALRKQGTAANVWKERASQLSLPEVFRHRSNSYVAWVSNNVQEALLEAELTTSAAARLDDQAARERFLRGWSRWIENLERIRDEAEVVRPLVESIH